MKKKFDKPVYYIAGIGIIIVFFSILLSPKEPIKLTFSTPTVQTNADGIAAIKGKTNQESEISVDGEELKNENGSFTYKVQLDEGKAKEITIVAKKGKEELSKSIEVKPSESFLAHLKAEETIKKNTSILKETKTALTIAEKNPTTENYDAAATLAQSLSKQYEEVDERLNTIKENIPIYNAVDLAEKEQSRQHLDSATALVDKATLNKKSLENRLNKVQEKIIAKENLEKQLVSTREAVEKAEQEPTDTHYDQALVKVNALPNDQTEFKNRLNTVKQTITTQKEEARKIADAQKAEQEAAQVAATNAATPETPTSQVVLVTPTGKKYHTHKCGNGTYTEATLEEALARGLTPCAKCY